MIPDSLDKFIKQSEIKDKVLTEYKTYPQEIQNMFNALYMCCYRLGNSLNLNELPTEIKEFISISQLETQNKFLMKRENKLQRIEQMFKSSSVDFDNLSKLVKGNI